MTTNAIHSLTLTHSTLCGLLSLVSAVLGEVIAKGSSFGCSSVGAGKTVLVEFSSPNIAKPFHAGHLRSTILGNFLQNLYRATGHNVTSYNYLGDWGKQYGLLAVGFAQFGDRAKLQVEPIRHLYEVYVKISAINKEQIDAHEKDASAPTTVDDEARAYFARMEAGDADALKLWKEFRELSITEYTKMYARLCVSFDVFSGESQVSDGMAAALELMEQKKLLFVNQGATLIDLEPYGKALGKCLIKKTDGTSLYITRDVAAAKQRFDKHQFDKMIYVVGDAQAHHFAQLFQVLKLMAYEWAGRCEHVGFGLVNGMSTRKGTAVFLDDILAEAKDVMFEIMKKNEEKFKEVEDPEAAADIIGMSAVIVQDLSAKRRKNYDFDWGRMTAFEGETGPYLQYTHSRCASIMRKAGVGIHADADVSSLTEPQAVALCVQIAKYPAVLDEVLKTHEPVALLGYLFDLARATNSAFVVLKVKGEPDATAKARQLLFEAARITLNNGMRMLGLKPLDRM